MEELFRMMVIRPPQQTDRQDSISIDQSSSLQNELKEIGASSGPFAVEIVLKSYIVSEAMIKNIAELQFYNALKEIFWKLSKTEDLNIHVITSTLEHSLGQNWKMAAGNDEWLRDRSRLIDAIMTLKLLNEELFEAPLHDLVNSLRTMSFIEQFKLNPSKFQLQRENEIRDRLNAVIILPAWAIKIMKQTEEKNEPSIDESNNYEEINKYRELESKEKIYARAYEELLALPFEMNQIETLSVDHTCNNVVEVTEKNELNTRLGNIVKSNPVIQRDAIAALSNATKQLLTEMSIDPFSTPIGYLLKRFEENWQQINDELKLLHTAGVQKVALIGNGVFPAALRRGPRGLASLKDNFDNTPITHGNLRPVGVGDLLVVKQQLVAYEAGDIAHIENILLKESKSREHRRRKMTEQFTLEEKEVAKEEELDQQSAQRYEMTREVQETLHEQTKMEAGLKVSAKYGLTVEVEANAKYATENAHDVSKKDSTHVSKEVTDKTSRKLTEKIRTQQTLRIVEEIEEINKHGYDNTDGNDHVIGVYQWLNKVYEAQVFNYGLRTMYDLVLQEPATMYIDALKIKADKKDSLVMPIKFNLDPESINELNYSSYVKMYEAQDVKAPPEYYLTVSKVFTGGPQEKSGQEIIDGLELPIPDGYEAFTFSVVIIEVNWKTDDPKVISKVCLRVGSNGHDLHDGEWIWTGLLSDETKTIPVSVLTYNTKSFTVNIEIKCRRTISAQRQWRLDTYRAILLAYNLRLEEYELKLKKQLEDRNGIKGNNPDYNKKLIQDELKRMAISIITQQTYDFIDPVEIDRYNFPHPRLNVSGKQGEYIRFFEQAFEWENMTYAFYPYYWSRKETWLERFDYIDADPLFMQFIKAGAARVVVPARPGFEPAIDHFMKTGKIWNGKGLPDITDPLYIPIIQEIRNQMGAPLNEKPWGPSWKVKLPTDLVRLRPEKSLPVWKKNNYGEWVSTDI